MDPRKNEFLFTICCVHCASSQPRLGGEKRFRREGKSIRKRFYVSAVNKYINNFRRSS